MAPLALGTVAVLALSACTSSGGDAPKSSASGSATTAAAGCVKGTGPGLTADTLTAAVALINFTGTGGVTNKLVGIPEIKDQEAIWNSVADNINKNGGAACRQIQLKFYTVNPFDQAGMPQLCLTIANSHPYVAIDLGGLSAENGSDCIPRAKVPLISDFTTVEQMTKYHPYYLSSGSIATDEIRNGVLALNQLGYFTEAKGFKKLGVLYLSCTSANIDAMRAALKEANVAADQVEEFNLGCPAGGLLKAASLQQAVLKFKTDGVSTVTDTQASAAVQGFSQVASRQKFKPIYALVASGVTGTGATGSNTVVPANFDGAINIAADAFGEEATPGFVPSAATKECDAIFTAAGLKPVYEQPHGYGGIACKTLAFVKELADHVTTTKSDALGAVMPSLGTVEYSYPGSPINYSAAPKDATYGVGSWRAETYAASCSCWNVPDPTWNPPFK